MLLLVLPVAHNYNIIILRKLGEKMEKGENRPEYHLMERKGFP